MKIDCLMGTYGRHSAASEALACFLQQSALSAATLLIYNQHPIPLHFQHPRVRVVNEPSAAAPMRYLRQRMYQLADPSAELIHWWDDDDLYLPWHLQDCLENIGDSVAWKPASSWMLDQNNRFSRHSNRFEATWAIRADYLRSVPLDSYPTFTEHPVFRQIEDRRVLTATDLGGRTSFIYRRWHRGAHLSGYGGALSEEAQRAAVQAWRQANQDVRLKGAMEPLDLNVRWRQYLAGTKKLVTSEEWDLNRRGCGMIEGDPSRSTPRRWNCFKKIGVN